MSRDFRSVSEHDRPQLPQYPLSVVTGGYLAVRKVLPKLKQVKSNLLVVAGSVGSLHHGDDVAGGAGVRRLGHSELVLRIVPEARVSGL